MNPTVFPIAAYSLTSDKIDTTKLREIARYQLVPLLSSINGVAQAAVMGGSAPEIRVNADPGLLASYDMTMKDVADALSASNILQVT